MNHIASAASLPSVLTEAMNALRRNNLRKAETLIRARLAGAPDDLEAGRLLAGVEAAHLAPLEAPDALAEAITWFLGRIDIQDSQSDRCLIHEFPC